MTLDVQKPTDPAGVTLESWAQGFMVGSLIMMSCVTVANMRRKVLLHKLILVEVWILFSFCLTLLTLPAHIRDVPRHVHVHQSARLSLVSERDRNLS